MKLNIETPTANAPIVCAESPQCPAIAVEKIPMSGTVMLDTMFGIAMRKISLFIAWQNYKKEVNDVTAIRKFIAVPSSPNIPNALRNKH